MKTENKRTYTGESFSLPKRQANFKTPFSERNRPAAPARFPAMSISKHSGSGTIQRVTKLEVENRMARGNFHDFNERWLGLHALMQNTAHSSENSVYIDFDEALCLRVKQQEEETFHSKALGEAMLRDYSRQPNPYHRYVKIKECFEGKEITLIKITYSPLGKTSELCWIEKGNAVSGNKLFEIHEWLQNLLKPGKVLLFDDAKIAFTHGAKKHNLSLRYLKVFTSGVAPFKSWYEERGYELYEGSAIEFDNGKKIKVFGQSRKKYLEAKTYLRNITLMRLGTGVLVERMDTSMMVQKLFQKFVQKENPTMADLIQALSEQSRQSQDSASALLLNIRKVFSGCLKEWESKDPSGEVKTYLEHVKTLRMSRVYVKKFQESA
jgi:hypothetical protein